MAVNVVYFYNIVIRKYGRLLDAIAGSNPACGMDVCLFECFMLLGRGLCDGTIPRLEEFY